MVGNSSFYGRDNKNTTVNETDDRFPVDVLPVMGSSTQVAAGGSSARVALPAALRGYSVTATAACRFRIGDSGVTAADSDGGGHYMPAGGIREFLILTADTHIAAIGADSETGVLHISVLD